MMGSRKWESMKCPIPGCDGDLYVEQTAYFPLVTDALPEDFAELRQAISESWQVTCSEDHVIMFPTLHDGDNMRFGQPCSQCEEEGVVHDDIAELKALLAALTPNK